MLCFDFILTIKMKYNTKETLFLVLLICITLVSSRIHKLILTDDDRHYVALTSFGFLQGGILEVKLVNLVFPSGQVNGEYGLTLDRSANDVIRLFIDTPDTCILKDSEKTVTAPQHPAVIFLKMDFQNKRLNISCKGVVPPLYLYPDRSYINQNRIKRGLINTTNRLDKYANVNYDDPSTRCSSTLPMTKNTINGFDYYNASFALYVATVQEEGIYNVYFHNCPNSNMASSISMVAEIYESNRGENFLSAGEMPLPELYTLMSIVFFVSAVIWTTILKTSKHPVYKIHIIMCVLVYLKALSLAFHGINYHFIMKKGEHVTAWAILYYITHLLKGAVLFVTIVLVGTGWNFIKHILSDRDKKLFMIVIPLQVVANVAEIIIAESEKGAVEHNAWRSTFISVDLVCCGAILFPIVWSIRHLQDASSTDGKAAINLRKLKLFRHFYLMVVCYIYFTRIIYLLNILKIAVPFHYSWIDELFRELATFTFFVMTGYKFRPAAANPYFTPTDLDDDNEDLVLSKIGILEGVSKLPNRGNAKKEDTQPLMNDYYSD